MPRRRWPHGAAASRTRGRPPAVWPVSDQRGRLLVAALGFAGLPMLSYDRALLGAEVLAGLLARYRATSSAAWHARASICNSPDTTRAAGRATFYTTGMEHSITSATARRAQRRSPRSGRGPRRPWWYGRGHERTPAGRRSGIAGHRHYSGDRALRSRGPACGPSRPRRSACDRCGFCPTPPALGGSSSQDCAGSPVLRPQRRLSVQIQRSEPRHRSQVGRS
jgi:hypothetical protein